MAKKNKKKKSIVKRLIKVTVTLLTTLFILLLVTPYLFKDTIKKFVVNAANNKIENAKVGIENAAISFIKSFPYASVNLEEVSIISSDIFKGDTLFFAQEVTVAMRITELFKKKNFTIRSFGLEQGKISIQNDSLGNVNYDIIKETPKQESSAIAEKDSAFVSLNIQEYFLKDVSFYYKDDATHLNLTIKNINHTGKGNFAQNTLDLDTKTQAKVSFTKGNSNYFNNIQFTADAILGLDLTKNTYTFKENKILINQLPLEFEGTITVGENNSQLYDIEFFTPTSTFKNLLGLIPQEYAGNLETISTEGSFDIQGTVNGLLSDTTIPKFDIALNAKEAMFHYKNLPKSVENINLSSRISNNTSILDDTFLEINSLSFTIDKDVFTSNAQVHNIINNPKINLIAKGKINLDHISKAYPIPDTYNVKGILDADINTQFDLKSIREKRYEAIKNSGSFSLSDFVYKTQEINQPIFIDDAWILFSPSNITLNKFSGRVGETDLTIKGKIDNFYGFLFSEQDFKGNFSLVSNTFKVSDFMTANNIEKTEGTTSESSNQALRIPAFLDCTFTANANTVAYNDIVLKNASGILVVKNQEVAIQNLTTDAFGGQIKVRGNVATKDSVPNFGLNLNLENLNIHESFSKLSTLHTIIPITNFIDGKMISNLEIKGDLKNDLTPNTNTISGNLLAQIFQTKLNTNNSPLLSSLQQEVPFFDRSKINLDRIQTYITFKEGSAVLKPLQLKYEDITIDIEGAHGFNKNINYDLTFNVPAKYLGNEVTNLLSSFSAAEKNKLEAIPIKASLTGSFTNPKVSTDLKETTNIVAKKLIQQQKNQLLTKGKGKLLDLLDKKKDTTSKTNNFLKGLLKKKKGN